jgi:hypothetical protein
VESAQDFLEPVAVVLDNADDARQRRRLAGVEILEQALR